MVEHSLSTPIATGSFTIQHRSWGQNPPPESFTIKFFLYFDTDKMLRWYDDRGDNTEHAGSTIKKAFEEYQKFFRTNLHSLRKVDREPPTLTEVGRVYDRAWSRKSSRHK